MTAFSTTAQTAVFPNPSKNPQISLMTQICNFVAVKICVNLRYLWINYLQTAVFTLRFRAPLPKMNRTIDN